MNASMVGLFVAGLVLLTLGADLLVRGAVRLAAAAGLSSLVIGLTVVAFGTSAPEVGASMAAALLGQGDLALGNIVGSNIFNVLFILGTSALAAPLIVAPKLVRIDVPIMIATSLLLMAISLDGRVGLLDGLVLLTLLIAYVTYSLRGAGTQSPEVAAQYESEFGSRVRDTRMPALAWSTLLVVIGLVLLVWGSRWLVEGASAVARALHVSELVIGLTVIAAGTSLPELATSFVASLRGERDIAVGNVIGSNIFNILGALGLSSVVAPGGIAVSTSAFRFDIPIMVVVALLCVPTFRKGHRMSRRAGATFILSYALYAVFLFLQVQAVP